MSKIKDSAAVRLGRTKADKKRLRIGIVCYPSIGGSGIVATNLGLELARRGHQIHFISYEEPFLLKKKPARVFFHQVHINEYNLFKYPDYTLPLAVMIEEVQKKYRLDLVHVHYAVPHATAALLARRIMRGNNIPLPKIITTLHGTDITLLAQDKSLFSIIKYSIERSHGVTAVSKSLRHETIKILKPSRPIEVIYNFYTPQPITKSRAAIRKGLRIKDNDFVTIHMSNLRPVKKVADLLKVAAKLKNHPRFKLLILAGGDFGECQKLVKKLGIQKSLVVRHNIKDIQNYINASDVGVYTSETESFGMGILETMSYGRPVLATAAGGVPEVVRDGQDGFLLPVGDVSGFADKIKLLMTNPRLAEKLGSHAQERAAKLFSAKMIVKKYLDFYGKILNN